MIDRRINPSEVKPKVVGPKKLFKVLRKQVESYENYNYDNIPSSMRWLTELLNCIISQRKMNRHEAVPGKLMKLEQRSKMVRNIVMQEVEKNVNALFNKVTHTYTIKSQAVKLSYSADLFAAPLIQHTSLTSTDLWLYLHQGFRYSETYDLVSA